MKLLTKAILANLPPLGSQSESADPTFWVKFFTPDAGWTWFAAEGEREESGDFLFWGYVIGIDSSPSPSQTPDRVRFEKPG